MAGRLRVCLVVALLAGVMAAPTTSLPAHADAVRIQDPDDSPGRLDIAAVRHGHHLTPSGRRLIEHRVRTYEAWGRRTLEPFNSYIRIALRHRPTDQNWMIWISYHEGKLTAQVYEGFEPRWEQVAELPVRRPNRRTVVVRFPRRLLNGVSRYDWVARTSYESSSCPDVSMTAPPQPQCPDRTSRVTHRLR